MARSVPHFVLRTSKKVLKGSPPPILELGWVLERTLQWVSCQLVGTTLLQRFCQLP